MPLYTSPAILPIKPRITLTELEGALGDNFIKVKRGCLVSALAIHSVTDKINLCNGESLDYVVRNKKEILAKLHAKQQDMIHSFNEDGIPATADQYHAHYRLFDTIPFAFADIEMVFDGEYRAIDWVFRYGNPALAQLEKCRWKRGEAAAALGLNLRTLQRKMKRLGMNER